MNKCGKEVALSEFEIAMGLWERYTVEYRMILDEYRFYLRIKRELGITPVNRLSKIELEDFPDIVFLGFHRQIDAEEYLEDLSPSQIETLIKYISVNYIDNGLIQNLRTRISDYKRQIAYSDVPCSKFGFDPDKCTSGSHTRQHKVLASSRF